MLGVNPFGRADVALALERVVHPDVAACDHVDLAARAPQHDDLTQTVAPTQTDRFIDDGLQGQLLTATQLLVGRDDHDSARVFNAVTQALGREATEDHRVGGTDAGAGLHGHHAFDRHGQVQHHAIALFHPLRLQRVGQATHTREQVTVGDMGDLAVIRLEDDGHFVAPTSLHMAIQAVVRSVDQAVVKPAVERRMALVERPREGLVPREELSCQARPVAGVVFLCFGTQFIVGRATADVSGACKGLRDRVEGAGGLVGTSHGVGSWGDSACGAD